MYRITILLVFFVTFTTCREIYNCSPCKCVDSFKWNDYNLTLKSANCINLNITTLPSFNTDIEGLAMNGNKFMTLEENFLDRYPNLKILAAGDNRICSIHKNAFKSLKKLKYIHMNLNPLTLLPTELFKNTPNLSSFVLGRNNVTRLQNYLFSNLLHLKRVNFYENNINVIEKYSFYNLPSLKTLNLTSNSLKIFDLNYHDFPSLKYLYLSNNPWNCDYSLCNTINTFKAQNLRGISAIPSCATPENLKGKNWNEITTYFAPTILSNISNINEGDDIIITCKHCFISDIVWTVNGRELSSKYYEMSEGNSTSTLILKNAQKVDSANYSCQINDCYDCKDFKYVAVNEKFKAIDTNKTKIEFSGNSNNCSKKNVPSRMYIHVDLYCD